jgi:hypothetical protein
MTYKPHHDYSKDVFYFNGDQAVDQANDANVDQDASIEQVADVDQELNQAVVQSSEQNTVVSVEGGDNGFDVDADLLDFLGDLPPGILRQILGDLDLDLGGGDVDVEVSNENNQTGFNVGANNSVVIQAQLAAIEQDQDVGIGQFNFASLDAF